MNLTIFWRAWKLDFWSLPGVYPPGLALADYWSHLLGVYTFDWAQPRVYPPYWSHLLGVYPPWPEVYHPSLALGLPF